MVILNCVRIHLCLWNGLSPLKSMTTVLLWENLVVKLWHGGLHVRVVTWWTRILCFLVRRKYWLQEVLSSWWQYPKAIGRCPCSFVNPLGQFRMKRLDFTVEGWSRCCWQSVAHALWEERRGRGRLASSAVQEASSSNPRVKPWNRKGANAFALILGVSGPCPTCEL